MVTAIAVWQNNVSSVFDFAHQLLLVEWEDGTEKNRREISLVERSGPERVVQLKQLGVDVLICGAVSRSLAYMLSNAGIEVLPFVTGSTEQVLNAYKAGQLYQPQFALPGCWEGARKCFRQRRGRRGRKW